MAAAANLSQAAQQSWGNLQTKSIAGTLRANILAFCSATEPTFPSTDPGSAPVANWLAVLRCFASSMTASPTVWSGDALRTAALYVYRLCYMGEQARAQTMISVPNAAILLAAYNANF